MTATPEQTAFPALFVSHGAPTLALTEGPARRFLSELGETLGQPRAILVLSAHWESPALKVTGGDNPETIHDFRGFPEEYYALRYAAPGAPDVAKEVIVTLAATGHSAIAEDRGYDHGVWVPLMLMYPEAKVPVIQLSIDPDADPSSHLALGEALADLRLKGVLIIGSGSLTHNLHEVRRDNIDADAEDWVVAFGDWMHDRLQAADTEALLDYRRRAPNAERNHPTDEHLLPLYAAMGAGGPETARRLHTSHTYGTLAMDVYAFG